MGVAVLTQLAATTWPETLRISCKKVLTDTSSVDSIAPLVLQYKGPAPHCVCHTCCWRVLLAISSQLT